jgi:hypothetical protein
LYADIWVYMEYMELTHKKHVLYTMMKVENTC